MAAHGQQRDEKQDETDEEQLKVRKFLGTSPSMKMINLGKRITGVTIVDDQLFVVLYEESQVNVYDSLTLTACPSLSIAGMKGPADLAGCSHNKALYISDWGLESIHRVSLTDGAVKSWTVRDDFSPQGISVTSEHNLLVTAWAEVGLSRGEMQSNMRCKSIVVEYTSEGQQVREIKLDAGIEYPWHTVALSDNQFLVCYGFRSSLHRLCVIGSDGQIIKTSKTSLQSPRSIAKDQSSSHLFLADNENHRVLIFSRDLALRGQVQVKFSGPYRLHYDSQTDRLFVGEEGGRMLIIEYM